MKADSSRDALRRRHRTRPVATGKSVTPQSRDIVWMQKLHEHGPLPSSHLHAFTKDLCVSPKRARDRLTDLFNEDRTPHGGAYLVRPLQQFRTLDARYQELVHDLSAAGERCLREHDLWHDSAGGASGPWRHRHLVACITSAIELATLKRDDVYYIPQHAILDRTGASLRYPVPFINPKTGKSETRDLIPDALFGLEYRKGSRKSYRFFLVEADRGTEPTRASRFNRKSHLRNFLQYREYVGRGLYKDHLGLTAGLLVLNVTLFPKTAEAMMKLLIELNSNGNSYQLFRTLDGNGISPVKPIGLDSDMLTGWQRAGHEPFHLV